MIDLNRDPTPRQLRQFGWLWLAFVGGFGLLHFWRGGWEQAPWIVWGLAIAVPVLGWLIPAFMRAVFVGASLLAWPIGFVLSHLLLGIAYYLILTPIGLAMRLFGYDPMRRRKAADSYWIQRPGPAPMKRYFRQF